MASRQQNVQRQDVKTSKGGLQSVDRFTSIAAASFVNDPFTRRFISENDGLLAGAEITFQRRYAHFLPIVRGAMEDGAELVEAGDWGGIAIWVPPTPESPTPIANDVFLRPALKEYKEKGQEMKIKYLNGRKHLYLNIICRNPDMRGAGIIRALLEPYITRATSDCIPIWLEASNTHARDVYSHFGFCTAEVGIISAGTADAEGNPVKGGAGLAFYGMIWEPENTI